MTLQEAFPNAFLIGVEYSQTGHPVDTFFRPTHGSTTHPRSIDVAYMALSAATHDCNRVFGPCFNPVPLPHQVRQRLFDRLPFILGVSPLVSLLEDLANTPTIGDRQS